MSSKPSSEEELPRHPIQVAARRTGLTPEVIRAWERRYGAVRPERDSSGQRRYSDRDVQRLRLLAAVTRAGRRIGTVADVSDEELAELAKEDRRAAPPVGPAAAPEEPAAAEVVEEAVAAIAELDEARLEALIGRAFLLWSAGTVIDDVVAPLMREVGERWWRGELDPGNEHLASAVVLRLLARLRPPVAVDGSAPLLVVATPAGERHQLGATLAAASAAAAGWRVLDLGPDLPADAIAGVAKRARASAIGMSVVGTTASPEVAAELRALRERAGPDVVLFVGGGASHTYADTLREIGARHVPSIRRFREELARVAGGGPKADPDKRRRRPQRRG